MVVVVVYNGVASYIRACYTRGVEVFVKHCKTCIYCNCVAIVHLCWSDQVNKTTQVLLPALRWT